MGSLQGDRDAGRKLPQVERISHFKPVGRRLKSTVVGIQKIGGADILQVQGNLPDPSSRMDPDSTHGSGGSPDDAGRRGGYRMFTDGGSLR